MKTKNYVRVAVVLGSFIAVQVAAVYFLARPIAPVPDRDEANAPTAGEEFEGNAEQRREWFLFPRQYPFEVVPEDARRQAWEDVKRRADLRPEDVGTTWVSIGPAPTTSAFPDNGGFTSGRINAIAISPNNNQLVLIGSASGGVWRSTNGGTSFTPVSDNQVDLAVGSIAFAPGDPNIVYACMGDKDTYFGTGVLKSQDAGATWALVSGATLPSKARCTKVLVDPNDANKVYVAQYSALNAQTGGINFGGVYVSTNGGVNWTRTVTGSPTDLVMHPTNSQILYMATPFDSNQEAGVYRSQNGGTSWTKVYDAPSVGFSDEFRLGVTPASANRVYAYFRGAADNSSSRLEVSNDSGTTWSNRNVLATDATGVDGGQFTYNNYLAVSPTNANTLYIGSRDMFRSTDGGLTFTDVSNAWGPPWPDDNYTPTNQSFHSDQQGFAFQPGSGNIFYAANDGGIWKTTDGGNTFTSLNNTLTLSQFVGIAIHPTDPTKTYGGTQDNGTQRRVNGGLGWKEERPISGDGGRVVVNPADPSMIYASYVNGSVTRMINDATTFSGKIGDGNIFNSDRIAFYPPIVGNGNDAKLYVGSYRLYRCEDCNDTTKFISTNGTPPTWTAVGGDFDQTKGGTDVLSAIGVARSNNQVIYTGSRQGRAMVSTNGGSTWTDTGTLPNRSISSIVPSSTNPALVYLTMSGYGTSHVFRSTNSGAAWTDINANLPNIPVNAIIIDPLTPTTLYVGTDIGVFRSTNDGGSWAVFSNGMPPVAVMAFASHPNGLIQAGTYGRGVYELPVTGAASPTPTPTPVASPTPTATATRTPTPSPTPVASPTPGGKKPLFDFDGDGKADVAVFRPADGNWYVNRSRDGFYAQNFGTAADKLAPADYDGDGKTDIAVYRPASGVFFIYRSSDGGDGSAYWGLPEDIPCPADFDGDGKADIAIYRPTTNQFWIRRSASGNAPLVIQYGAAGDVPVVGDYDGDGKADVAVYRPSSGIWFMHLSGNNSDTAVQFGTASDKVVPGDFDGDGKTDVAVYRTQTGVWFIVNSTGGFTSFQFGFPADTPAPADYDGDGKIDYAIFRPGENNFWISGSRAGVTVIGWGTSTDIPIENAYVR